MIPCFVISLPDCTRRRRTVGKALTALGIDFAFFNAVDGRHGLDPVQEGRIDRGASRRAGRALTNAEFACALSHIGVYERVVASDIPCALILEDDAVPGPPLLEFLAARHWQDADLIQLYHSPSSYVQRRGTKTLFQDYVSYLNAPHMRNPGAVGYTISYQGAKHIVANAVPVCSEADWPDCVVRDLAAKNAFRCVHPPLVGHQSDFESIIGTHGRGHNKERHRVLGVYAPPLRKMLRSWRCAPYKMIHKRLPRPIVETGPKTAQSIPPPAS